MKLTKLLLLALSLMGISACGPSSGGQVDVNPYKLTLSYSSNVQFDKNDLTATFAFGQRHDVTTRSQDEINEYLRNGAKQEDIDKTGKRQNDGSYFFFSGDPIILSVPDISKTPGFKFLGFFEKNTNQWVYTPKKVQCTLDDGSKEMLMARWEMPNRNIELEARYEYLTYDVTYCDMDGKILYPVNPVVYDGSLQTGITLLPQEKEGYEFKRWYYKQIVFLDNGGVEQKIVTCTKLPDFYDDTIISTTPNGYELILFAEYERSSNKHDVTFKIDNQLSWYSVKLVDLDGKQTDIRVGTNPIQVEHGYKLDIWVDTSMIDTENYEFAGIFVNGVECPVDAGGRHNNHPDQIVINKDTIIEAKVSKTSNEDPGDLPWIS